MEVSLRFLRFRLGQLGLWPTSRLARAAWYLLALDAVLFVAGKTLGRFRPSWGDSLSGWVTFLFYVAVILFLVLGFRWLKTKLLWRLRNRLIVTYLFIGVIPVVLLVVLAGLAFYLFAGQFSTFVVTAALDAEIKGLDSANSAIAHELSARLQHGTTAEAAALEGLRQTDQAWADRQVCVWLDGKLALNNTPAGMPNDPVALPSFLKETFHDVVRDGDKLYLRAAESIVVGNKRLTVLSTEPFDKRLLEGLATDLGELTLYSKGIRLSKVEGGEVKKPISGLSVSVRKQEGEFRLETPDGPPTPTYLAGAVPPPKRFVDTSVVFTTTVPVVNWENGDTTWPAAIKVETRVSKLYDRLFAALGDLAPLIEFILLFVAAVFAVIELFALWIGMRLTRTVTGAVAELYNATIHVNSGDLGHRIVVQSRDQLAALANSFNSMTASLEDLIEQQREKQKLENELVIAQEVQAQLFPRANAGLPSLEVYGFCRPARTVSGDYYDFLALDSEKMILAVGDISGKGISAALLMATVHSAVRAYSLEGIPALREPVAVGARSAQSVMVASGLQGAEVSPGTLLALLNHQLYESTPSEKYATMFLGTYDGEHGRLTYSNGGHLPPIIMSADGSIRKLDQGGTVIGLFDNMTYEEASVQMRPGEIFLAYSDGVTEPENDFGEFGEERLIDLLRENRQLPLAKISEIVTAAVDDWIGANEQPDDVTLVLARAR